MKRFLCVLLTAIMLIGMVNVVSAEETVIPEKVEISFKVGDSTLMINGNAVTVETPYVVGAGTTLVPLRVITEAFGAKVTWVNETKEIILEYPDVNITLQIGNINATVNEHTETLPEAPVLSPNGVTMVPLRFISETFGATVGYDNATAAITVVKENAKEEDTISSSTDLPRIGDSYWNWSMMTPPSMMMTDRWNDGTSTTFEDEECILWIDIYDYEEEAEEGKDIFKESYDSSKDYFFSGLTLSKDQKGTDSLGNKTYRITGRDKEEYIDCYAVLVENKCYEVVFSCPVGHEKISECTTLLESFKVGFASDEEEKKQTHDLSNVDENGYRLIEDDYLKISFKVPATMADTRTDIINLMWLTSGKSDDCTEVTVGVYSKTDEVSSKTMAQKDKQFRELYYNPKVTSTTEVFEYNKITVGENPYYYVFTTNGLVGGDYQICDVYFEKGDYIYNVTVTHPAKDSTVFEKVVQTLSCEELDSEEMGVLLKTEIETEPYKVYTDKWTMDLSSAWEEYGIGQNVAGGAEAAIYVNKYTNSIFTVTTANVDSTKEELKEAVQLLFDEAEGKAQGKIEEGVTGSNSYYKFVTKIDDEDGAVYQTVYVLKLRTRLVMFTLMEPEEAANARVAEEIFESIGTFEFKK